MRIIRLLFLSLCLLWGGASAAQDARVEALRLSRYQGDTLRFVAELSSEADVSVFRLESPTRLVVDFKKCAFGPAAQKNPPQPLDFIQGCRLGNPDKNTARIVLDLPGGGFAEKHFLLRPQGSTPWRFVLDITPAGVRASTPPAAVQELPSFARKKQRVVVLDPGHGGRDPGAVSRTGNYEKKVTLRMAQETKKLLEQAGYQVVLTRDRDVYVSLRGRIQKAHEASGDLFISIHADSARNPAARGLSVYTISERASDQEAAALAEQENKSDILFGMDLGEYQPEVGNILIDFAKKHTMDQSAAFAKHLVREMRKTVKLVPNAHRFAGFVVLKSPNIPSVLVELGYLSNRQEDKMLQQKSYRNDLAEALVLAVDSYFKEYP